MKTVLDTSKIFSSIQLALCATAVLSISIRVANAADPGEKTKALTAIIQSDAALFDKARACQQLGEVGNDDAVKALSSLLGDPKLSAFARSGLEGIANASARSALREAAGKLQGNLLIGVVNSIGSLRDEQAVALLRKLATDRSSGVSREAWLALGNIANADAIRALKDGLISQTGDARLEVATGCLLAADNLRRLGDDNKALSFYDSIRADQFPISIRVGATRGAILTHGSDRIEFLVSQIKSDEKPIRNAALLTIREMPEKAVPSAINAEISRANSELQGELLWALADRHNDESIAVVAGLSDSADSGTRRIALTVLGRMGEKAAPALLAALTKDRSNDERAVVLSGLRGMSGTAVDEQVRQALEKSRSVSARVDLIQLLESRFAKSAAPELIQQAKAEEKQVSRAAITALRLLGDVHQVSGLIEMAKSAQDGEIKEAAESALSGICSRMGQPGCEVVLNQLNQTSDSAQKNVWIRVLARGGCMNSLPALQQAAADREEAVAENALAELGRWPNAEPVPVLVQAAESGATSKLRQRARASVFELVATAVDESSVPTERLVGWLARVAAGSLETSEKVRLLGVLGRLQSVQSYRLIGKFIDDSTVANESALALIQVAPALAKSEEASSIRTALQKVAQATPDFRDRALQAAKNIPNLRPPVSLFDGRSLEGWEGDTKVWRVQDGVIVGGSMQGNPRNEFLATVRSYTNFILRLEYKLVGSEGFVNSGVQFQSVRITNPPNEMKGYQADIGAGFSGVLYDESRRNMILSRVNEDIIKRIEHVGDWNRYEIQCEGRHIQLRLNGEKTVDYTELDNSLPLSGLIGLQIHGGNKAEISFRNITIQEL